MGTTVVTIIKQLGEKLLVDRSVKSF